MKKNYGMADERTPLTKTVAPDYVYMTNPNRVYRKQVHQFQCCVCTAVLTIFAVALTITILYSVDKDKIDNPDLPADNASLQLLLGQTWPLPDNGVPPWQLQSPTPQEVEQAVAAGQASLAARDSLEASGSSLPVNSPSYRHQVSIKTSARATNLARSAYVMEVATKTFVLRKSASKDVTKSVGRGPVLGSKWLPTAECGEGPLPACPPSSYRTIDGSCNNPYKPNKWGVAMRPYRRQLAPDYADGISAPRQATDGSPLPSARAVSVTVHRPVYRDDPNFTVMLAVWGQFMDHDVTATALSLGAGGKPISCCQNSSSTIHPECFPVYLSKDDPYYSQYGITCMEFVRSAPAPTCSMGPREQLNQVSSYLDGSVVYGNTPELSRSLRSYQGGQLKMLETPDGRTLLPISTNLDDGCNREEENAKGKYCFMSGDTRANENTHLTALHLLMARQHNLLATQLSQLNPEWNDEQLYQEARKIVAAQMQHITYNEFVPVLLGPDMMSQLDLAPQESGYYQDYDPSVDATISNNFATSAFRFAHTLLPALMKTVAKDWQSEESIEMHKMLFDPYKLYQKGALDETLRGAVTTQLERADSYFNTQMTQHLFQASGADDVPSAPGYGLDLVSLNVQRGRDHGLPAYPAWREFCGLSRPKTFEDMEGMVDAGSLERIKSMYKSVDDIDMYTGALSEFPIEGGLVGPTITCLVSDQFKRLKQGDSFWYETDKKPQALSPEQLDEIRKTSLAGIICDTSDEVTMVQPQVMRSVGPSNARVACSAIPRPDLTKWVEPIKKSAVGTKYARIAVTVTGGSIKTSTGEVLWDGTVPVQVPLPLFNVKKTAPGSPTGAFGHGVQWQGALSMTSSGLDVSGTFSYPVFTHGPVPLGTNYSIKWVNGEFQLTALVTSNNTDISSLTLPGSYESPIFFSETKSDDADSKKKIILGTAEDTPSVIGDQKLPLILVGSSSPDKTSFFWSGNATIIVPSLVPPAILASSKDVTNPSISGVFSVVSGSIQLDASDGSSSVIWDGTLPTAVPYPLPYKFLMATGTGEKLPVFGNGLVWSTSISGSLLEGSFSFPQYSRDFGMVSVNWLNGQFSLELLPLMNTTLGELITPGVKYTSRIIFREEPAPAVLQLNSLFTGDEGFTGSLESLVVESQEVIDGIIPAPLILHGTFSPDKTKFYFNGKVILAVKPSKPSVDKQLKLLNSPELSVSPWGSPTFGGSVTSGHISAGLNGASTSLVWSGTLPVDIPMPTFFSPIYDSLDGKSFLFGNGVVWSATLSGSTIKGTFAVPQTVWSTSGIKQQTWAGEFAFEVSALWNTTLASVFVPGAKYYSKIHFQGEKYDSGLSSMTGVPGEDPTVTMSAPLILQGTISPDKKTFYWSGSFIIVFRNKPVLTFKIPKKPKKDDPSKPTYTVNLDITSGSITAGFIGAEPQQVWSGNLPVTIPYGSLISKDSWSSVPFPKIMWSGEVSSGNFEGTFAVPTYKQNGTSELVDWWAGKFSFQYTTKYDQLLENYVKAGKKYNFQVIFGETKQFLSNVNSIEPETKNPLVKFTQEAQAVIGDTKIGKLILHGKLYSKPFYCYITPFCSEHQEYYWSGSASLVFPDPPKNKSSNVVKKMAAAKDGEKTGFASLQFGGEVVSGSVEGGLGGDSSNVWWSGQLPVEIPTSLFWTNKTEASAGSTGGHSIQWSGILVGNTLKGTFSFPQLVMDFPVPSVQWWSGSFKFDIQPLWNASLDGLIKSEVNYSSAIHFQGVKVMDENSDKDTKMILGADAGTKQMAPVILQGTFSPDRTSFIWSGKFIISVKNYPSYSSLALMKSKTAEDPSKPSTPAKPVKPKTTVSFTVITGELSATNGSEPVQLWAGQLPAQINKDMFNPTSTPGAGVSVTWTADSLSPQLSGSFSVTVYSRNGSLLTPVSWSGNFSIHYLIKWAGSFESVVKTGKTYTCSVVFKDMVASSQPKSPRNTVDELSKQFVLGADEASKTPCTLLVTGKSYSSSNPFYCKMIPFICSNKQATNWFSFNGDALLIIKPPVDTSLDYLALATPSPLNIQGDTLRRINTTVISGSIVAGPESEEPRTLWSGNFPLNITLPVFWDSEDPNNNMIPEDIVHAHGVIWSGSQMGPHIEGSFSLPQYSKSGVKWWSGRFSFLLQTSWGVLGDLDGLIMPGINYNSKIVFRDTRTPTPLLTPSQFDIDSATSIPIILLGTYSPSRTMFYWSGNIIIGIRSGPWNFVNKSPNLQLESATGKKPIKTQRVGVTVSSGRVTNNTDGIITPLWSGGVPVTVPLAKFNISKGVNVIWTASTLFPKFSGNYSIPQYVKNTEGFNIEWIDGTFSFDVMPLWNTSLDVIVIGQQYATVISSKTAKFTKAEQMEMDNSFLTLILESEEFSGSQTGVLNLKGTLSPDKLYFTWLGEAWFYSDNNITTPKQQLQSTPGAPLRASQFGGAVYDGYVTTGTSSFFSFTHTVWAGSLPVEIPFSAFWSGSFAGSKFTRGVTWTATSVTDSLLAGTYSVPQYSWDGITTTVTWYKGDFKFSVRPVWNASLASLIQPGVQYYSRVSFQGESPLLNTMDTSDSDLPGVPAPIILQGTFSPDRASFFWTGNFVLNVKNKTQFLQFVGDSKASNKTTKVSQRVGLLVKSGSLVNNTAGNLLPIWSGSPPVTIPLEKFNVSKGVNVVWTASSLYPQFTGNFSISQGPNMWWNPVKWAGGIFSFDVTSVWNTSLDIIEVGKEYTTIINSNKTKFTKYEQTQLYKSFQSFAAKPTSSAGSSIGVLNLKGTLSPDNLYFTWLGEAWLYQGKTKSDSEQLLQSVPDGLLQTSTSASGQFGGAVYGGSVTSGSSSWFSFSSTLWSGNIPVEIPLSAFWSGSIAGGSVTRGVKWTVSSVSDSYLAGSYSAPQITWYGFTKLVTWYTGDFQFYVKPLWNVTLTSLVQPGVEYYSKISFQGEKPLLEVNDAADSDTSSVQAPVILKGTYSPDHTTFLWDGNFILNLKVKPVKPVKL